MGDTNVSNSGIGYLLSHVICVWNLHEISFSKQYRYVTNHLHLYVTNYYNVVCTITLVLLTMCLTLVIANISWNTSLTTIVKLAKSAQDLWTYFSMIERILINIFLLFSITIIFTIFLATQLLSVEGFAIWTGYSP